uniref:Uncharacterized protein n=1 Tax=Eptatretus burgeri TaxID=7764 RepID=A0A8C4QVN0_EPTBU
MAFLKLLKIVGDSGRFQLINAILLCIPMLVIPSHMLIQNFTAATPRHHCRVPWLVNASPEAQVAIPWEHDSLSKCSRYVRPQWQLLMNDSADMLADVEIEGCVDGWEFDSSEFKSTIVTEPFGLGAYSRGKLNWRKSSWEQRTDHHALSLGAMCPHWPLLSNQHHRNDNHYKGPFCPQYRLLSMQRFFSAQPTIFPTKHL